MRISIILLIMLVSSNLKSQTIIDLVEAERSFARHAMQFNTKDAFLKYMDSSAVMFVGGEVKNAKQLWDERSVSLNKLIWEPAFAILSATKDLGITTGPWVLKHNDTILGQGHFATVWHTTSTGEWKWLVDLGISHPAATTPVADNVEAIELSHLTRFDFDAKGMMLKAENDFIKEYTAQGVKAYSRIVDNDVWFNTQGHLPVYKKQNLQSALSNIPAGIQFSVVDYGIAKEGDIGYIYGYATHNGKKENYLRVWRRIGRKWSLILQTLLM